MSRSVGVKAQLAGNSSDGDVQLLELVGRDAHAVAPDVSNGDGLGEQHEGRDLTATAAHPAHDEQPPDRALNAAQIVNRTISLGQRSTAWPFPALS